MPIHSENKQMLIYAPF